MLRTVATYRTELGQRHITARLTGSPDRPVRVHSRYRIYSSISCCAC